MVRFKFFLLFLIFMMFFFSCSGIQKTAYKHGPPPPPPMLDFPVTGKEFLEEKQLNLRKIIAFYAVENLDSPYKWGGQSPKTGFDCSGLSIYTHQKAGILIPRTAKEQFNQGKIVSRQDIKMADLVFFKNRVTQKVYHVGIYMGDDFFVHAPGNGKPVSYGHLNDPYFKAHYAGARTFLLPD